MSDKRIIELDVTDVVEADDFLAIDSVSGKTRRIKPIKIGATYEIEDGDHSFTLVGSNGYSHTVDIPYDSVSMTQAEYNALTPAQKADGTARFLTDAESDVESELWSKVGRQTLDTDAQVLSNAVNELVDKTDDTNDIVGDGQQVVGTDLTDAVNQLNSSLNNKSNNLLVEYKTIPLSYASETNPVATGNFNAGKSGYTTLGIVGYQVAGVSSSICFVPSMIINSSGTISYTVRATSGGTYSHTLYVYVLYVKN